MQICTLVYCNLNSSYKFTLRLFNQFIESEKFSAGGIEPTPAESNSTHKKMHALTWATPLTLVAYKNDIDEMWVNLRGSSRYITENAIAKMVNIFHLKNLPFEFQIEQVVGKWKKCSIHHHYNIMVMNG